MTSGVARTAAKPPSRSDRAMAAGSDDTGSTSASGRAPFSCPGGGPIRSNRGRSGTSSPRGKLLAVSSWLRANPVSILFVSGSTLVANDQQLSAVEGL